MTERNVTQHDIDKVNARRAWLEPYAQACGLRYDDSDDALMDALTALAIVGDRQKTERSRGSASGSKTASAAAPGNFTVLDQTVEIMAARRAGRPVADWATRPLPARGK